MTGPLLDCQGVTREFGHLRAVENVSLRLEAGEVVALLGANGAGKTTLVRLVLGLLRPTGGTVRLFGAEPSRLERRRLGYVPQNLGLYEDLSAPENLAFARAAFGDAGDAGPAWSGVPADVPVGRLSLGLQRRVAFTQALAHRPDLLVLDEPTSGVDVLGRSRLWEMIRGAADQGAGALVTTHSMEEALECDRVAVMASGRLIADGSVDDILAGSRVVVVEAGDWVAAFDAIDAAGLRAALVGRTLRVPGADRSRVRQALGGLPAALGDAPATLEERFVELTAGRR